MPGRVYVTYSKARSILSSQFPHCLLSSITTTTIVEMLNCLLCLRDNRR